MRPIALGESAGLESPLTFETDVRPIFDSACVECHGPDDAREAGLELSTLSALLRGGSNGPAIVPGHAEQSILFDMVAHRDMPPGDRQKLDAEQVDVLRRWIAAGAPADEATPFADAPGAIQAAESPTTHWAFQPLENPRVPRVVAPGGHADDGQPPRTPIDAFAMHKLQSHGLQFASEASRERLARRLYFDLLGLPPTPEQTHAFVVDRLPGAYERLVDRLLASPAFGVRWGRFWLDVAGYTDTASFDNDFSPPEGFSEGKWRYRD